MADANAEEICAEAMQQKSKMDHFCSTVQKLEVELIEEEKIIDDMYSKKKSGQAGDMLSQGLEARRTMVVNLNKELLALVESQTAITMKAAAHAGKMLGEIEANTKANAATMKTNKTALLFLRASNKDALEKMKSVHDDALKAKDDEHHKAKSKINKDHENVKLDMTKKMNEKSDDHIVAMSKLSKDHEDKASRMVSVNANFLAEVQKFVDVIKSLLSSRAQYDGVFTQIETAMKHISHQLHEFSGHATVVPQAMSLDPPVGGARAGKGGKHMGQSTRSWS